MKTLVAQLWDDPKVIGKYYGENPEVEKFWEPCMATVESWAEENGWEYKRFSLAELEPLLPDLSSVEHIMESNWNRACISKIGMLNNSDYDKIIVMDADIYIYGNPKLDDATFGVWIEDRWFPRRNFPIFAYPQGGLYYSTCGPDVYEWCYNQFTNPCREFEFIKMCYEMAKKNISKLNPTTSGEIGFGEQAVLCAYVNNHQHKNINNHIKYNGRTYSELAFPEPNCFIHFDGSHKNRNLQQFRAFLLYQKIDKFWEQNLHKLKSKGIVW